MARLYLPVFLGWKDIITALCRSFRSSSEPSLHLFGLGLFQARLAPLILTTLTLALTHRLGVKLFSPWHGAVAVAILVGWRIAGPFAHLVSGIPLADVARIVRYDSAVPVFGLLALLVFTSAIRGKSGGWKSGHPISQPSLAYLLIGLLIGLATLSHLYGAFWLPSLMLALFWLIGWRFVKPALIMGSGFGLALSPWLIFVMSGWSDFLRQNRNYADRFGLLDIRFYLINLLSETERYDPLLNGAKETLGAWLWLVTVGLSLVWLGRQSIRKKPATLPHISFTKLDPANLVISARILIASLITLAGLFALLLTHKTFSYLTTLWPILAIVIAAGFCHAWKYPAPRRWWRPILAGLFLLALSEGITTGWRMRRLAHQTTPYQRYTERIAEQVPPDSHLLGLQHYWLGLAETSAGYRSILVPIFWTTPKYVAQPVPFAKSAAAIPPNVVLLDQIMLDFLTNTAEPTEVGHPLHLEIQDYLAKRAGSIDCDHR